MGSISEQDCIDIQSFTSPCGELLLGAYRGRLCLCDWMTGQKHGLHTLGALQAYLSASVNRRSTDVLDRATEQLNAYFAGRRTGFDIPLSDTFGSDFQHFVWNELLHIPYGATISYSELAERIGRPKAVRAVANAVGANPLAVFVPCHRIVGKDGSLTGYAGGLTAKQYLLRLEQNHLSTNR